MQPGSRGVLRLRRFEDLEELRIAGLSPSMVEQRLKRFPDALSRAGRENHCPARLVEPACVDVADGSES